MKERTYIPIRKRNNRVRVSFTDEENKRFRERVASSGLTMQDFLLQTALHSEVIIPNNEAYAEYINLIRDLERDLFGIGNNINQIARSMNTYKENYDDFDMLEIESLKRELSRVRKEVKNLCQLLKTQSEKMVDTTHQKQ